MAQDSGHELEAAGFGRRFAALVVDWGASSLITRAFVSQHTATQSFFQLLVFFVEASVLTALTGASFGQHLLHFASWMKQQEERSLHSGCSLAPR